VADLSECCGEIETVIDGRSVNLSVAAGRNQEEVRKRLIQRSVEDEDLRQKLLSDPRGTVE
jgi:proline racemase